MVRSPSRLAEGGGRSFVNQVLAGVTQLFVRSWAKGGLIHQSISLCVEGGRLLEKSPAY